MDIRKLIRNTHDLISDLKPELNIKELQDDKTLKYIFDETKPPSKGKLFVFFCGIT
jgi:hypothetical protein